MILVTFTRGVVFFGGGEGGGILYAIGYCFSKLMPSKKKKKTKRALFQRKKIYFILYLLKI